MVMMPELAPVTDETQRADLARWAVSLRRAHAAHTRQVTGNLHMRNALDLGDDDYDDETEEAAALGGDSYCCLGIWCRVQLAAGVLQVRTVRQARDYASAAHRRTEPVFQEGVLPAVARLAGSSDPDLLATILQEDGPVDPNYDLAEHLAVGGDEQGWWTENESRTLTAAELNDDCGLNFAQIADVVVWRFGLTDAELAAAELAPRVPEVEGPA